MSVQVFETDLTSESEIFISLREHISRCFGYLRARACFMDYSLTHMKIEDGVALLSGEFRILHVSGELIRKGEYRCAVVAYLLHLRDITPEMCFLACLSQNCLGSL
jgi:hypothetical protein